jgi:hypothetical protein
MRPSVRQTRSQSFILNPCAAETGIPGLQTAKNENDPHSRMEVWTKWSTPEYAELIKNDKKLLPIRLRSTRSSMRTKRHSVASSLPEGVLRQHCNVLFEDILNEIDMEFLLECTLLNRNKILESFDFEPKKQFLSESM